jgi:hypothetical protein
MKIPSLITCCRIELSNRPRGPEKSKAAPKVVVGIPVSNLDCTIQGSSEVQGPAKGL